jgi:hypothetical protein
MHSSYLKRMAACPLKKVKPKPTRGCGFGSGFVSRMIGSPLCKVGMDAILVARFAVGLHV